MIRLIMIKQSTLMVKLSFSIVLLSLISACSMFSSEEEEEEPIELALVIQASANINPSEISAGNPVVINLYQLKSVDAFKSAQILDLLEKDSEILANDLVKRQTLGSILPKEKRKQALAISPGTKYLAVLAQFSNYSQSKSKAWVEITELDDIEYTTLLIDSLTVNLESTVEDSFWPW